MKSVPDKEHANNQERQSHDHARHSGGNVTSGEEPLR
jgi:hypothetical protein